MLEIGQDLALEYLGMDAEGGYGAANLVGIVVIGRH